MEITLASLSPRDRHALLTPLIAPRPIAFVSTVSAGGVGNLAPFSFFAMGGQNPQGVAFCPTADRNGEPKDTLRNVRETGEFTINVVSRAMAERVNQASAPYPFEVDEFDVTGYTRVASTLVKPPYVAEAPAALECRVFQLVPQGSGPMHGTWVIGEVLVAHIRDEMLGADGLPDTAKIQPAARLGRNEWASVTADVMFTQDRPTT
ncbi:MAG: flavin reductase family protein [Gemmatimonadaceae bacterium]|nr:flavin reductase family protein [Gemmatimonadaceae bacterium]MCW5825562.1 flavin reductase family protein [Gemmatimonadaceae bacterium]